jgi:lipoate-protein ligase A
MNIPRPAVIPRPAAGGGRTWLVIESAAGDAAFNMGFDEAILEAMPRLGKPLLRFYGWTERAASFGYFQKFDDVERATPLRPLVRRPTGGGIVPHDADWTYSVAFPAGSEWYSLKAEESYRRVHEWIQHSFARLNVETELASSFRKAGPGQCFVGYEKLDVLWHGRKIAGAAQRRTRDGLLVQGSIQPPSLVRSRADWQKAMRDVASVQGVDWVECEPDDALRGRATELAKLKYSQDVHNRRR